MSDVRSGAGFSADRRWRYWLSRRWDDSLPELAVIGLNPSTADEEFDDPTIRRCVGYAKAWNLGGLIMLNLFAWRATDPQDMKKATDPVGSFNDSVLREYTKHAGLILAAWGAHGTYRNRGDEVLNLFGNRLVHCLGTTNNGQPKHPLYLRADAKPKPLSHVSA